MRRIFYNPVTALLAGACLRLYFVLKFPATAGDTVIYEQLATNWQKYGKYAMDIGGQPVSVDLRMPGYPAFLAMLYSFTGHSGENARFAVMIAQIFVDLSTCVLIGALAALLSLLCNQRTQPKRIFLAGLWLSALCPLTANYTAVPLTEVWAVFFTALAFIILILIATHAAGCSLPALTIINLPTANFWALCVLAGLAVGLGTLFRPETPLLLLTSFVVMFFGMWRRREPGKWLLACAIMGCACVVPLLPWAIRNAATFHEFQPLAPKETNLPGELVPKGFMAWERTWLYRVRDNYLVPWKLNEEAINLDDLPSTAFDTPDEREKVAAILETYNDDLTLTPQEDAVFAGLARERTDRHPLRTYVSIPLRRAVRIWFTPRIELIPVSGHVFPLAYMNEEDPVDQRVTITYFFLNILYILLAIAGVWRLWRCRSARPAILILVVYILVRTAFLTTLEAPEPRYTLVCFPALLALGAQVFAGKQEKPI
jgi:uncharacterized membrane protein